MNFCPFGTCRKRALIETTFRMRKNPCPSVAPPSRSVCLTITPHGICVDRAICGRILPLVFSSAIGAWCLPPISPICTDSLFGCCGFARHYLPLVGGSTTNLVRFVFLKNQRAFQRSKQPCVCMDIWLKSCVEKTDEPADEKRTFDPLKERKRRADLPKGIFRVAIA